MVVNNKGAILCWVSESLFVRNILRFLFIKTQVKKCVFTRCHLIISRFNSSCLCKQVYKKIYKAIQIFEVFPKQFRVVAIFFAIENSIKWKLIAKEKLRTEQ